MSVSVSVQRLRVWLLVGAGLLVMLIAAFLGYAHWRVHRFLTKLPAKLGIDVRQETNAYTYSQTVQGRTIYTIHAAKAVQHKDGKYTLHDVGIVLYGEKQDRADRIYGAEFEYDPTAQIVRAMGDVFIDLQAPAAQDRNAKMDYAAGKDLSERTNASSASGKTGTKAESKDERLIHVKTSGLVYQQKLGLAETDHDIEFTSGGLVGHAVGADYNSNTGALMLHSLVKVSGLQRERPVVLTASRAELDRQNQLAVLSQAKYVTVGGAAGRGEGETVQAPHVVVHLRPDGTAQRLEAGGGVTATTGEDSKVMAPTGEMMLDEENRPVSVALSGGVTFVEDRPLRQGQGGSDAGRATFDRAGRVDHVSLTGAVHLRERVRASEAIAEPWSQRELTAGAAELALGADQVGKTQLKDAKATGAARLTLASPVGPAGAGGSTSSALAGDALTAHFLRVNGADHIAEVNGDGHTLLRRVAATGEVNTSSGDSLVANFQPTSSASAGKNKAGSGTDQIIAAVQHGHVVMTQVPVRKPTDPPGSQPQQERATAQRAAYDGDLERMTLTGSVQLSDGASTLWADRVVTEQSTGNATADGSVRVSYKEAESSAEPVHVVAARADFQHDAQVAVFFGGAGRPARLWQAASQVEAPVLRFEQKQKRLLAHGDGQGSELAVRTLLVNAGSSSKPGSPTKADPAKSDTRIGNDAAGQHGKTDVVLVQSRELVYSDETRTAEFLGGVHAESVDGTMSGRQAVAYLQAAPAPGTLPGKAMATGGPGARTTPGKSDAGSFGGSLERIVATGQIEMEQPGRTAMGEQVIYTASDGMFVLTGTAAKLPKVVDQQQGTITGTSLRFHAGDQNVVVSNGGDSAAGQRVRTETRVKNKR